MGSETSQALATFEGWRVLTFEANAKPGRSRNRPERWFFWQTITSWRTQYGRHPMHP